MRMWVMNDKVVGSARLEPTYQAIDNFRQTKRSQKSSHCCPPVLDILTHIFYYTLQSLIMNNNIVDSA
jgi:hypothetical protein